MTETVRTAVAEQAADQGRSAGPATSSPRPYLTPVPNSLPPFDDERSPAYRLRAAALLRRAVPATSNRPYRRPERPVAACSVADRADGGRAGAAPGLSATAPPGPTPARRRPEVAASQPGGSSTEQAPAVRAGQVLARGIVEVVCGQRPLAHLRRHCAPDVLTSIPIPSRATLPPAQIRSIRVCEPADGVAEVSAVFRIGPRTRALAFRMELLDGHWRVTALETG